MNTNTKVRIYITQDEFRRTFFTWFFCGDPESKQMTLWVTDWSKDLVVNSLMRGTCKHHHAVFEATVEMVEKRNPPCLISVTFCSNSYVEDKLYDWVESQNNNKIPF